MLSGGTVIDGSGAPRRAADLVIADGRIAELRDPGAGPLPDAETVDVSGRVVCPGFIDVHTHDDLALLGDPRLPAKTGQGVTTVIAGNCGIAAAPIGAAHPWRDGAGAALMGPGPADDGWRSLAEWADAVERSGPAVNVAFLAGHNALRLAAVGPEEGPVPADRMGALLDAAREAMDAGALGMSTGLAYPPGRGATTGELVELARVVGAAGGLYATHVRDESDDLPASIDEAIEIGDRGGCPVHVSHLKSMGRANWGRVPAIVERLRAAGATCDVYPYTAASTALMPALRAVGRGPVVADDYLISAADGVDGVEGRTLAEIADEWSMAPLDAARRLAELTEGRAVTVYFVMCEEDLLAALEFERTMIGSDGLPVAGTRPHPRLYGTFPRVLVRYADADGPLTLEQAVHRMTGLAADAFGLAGRGRLEPGAHADVVVLDPERLEDRATYDEPAVHPGGIELVLVAGEPAWDSGGPRPGAGRVLRRGDGG